MKILGVNNTDITVQSGGKLIEILLNNGQASKVVLIWNTMSIKSQIHCVHESTQSSNLRDSNSFGRG